MTGPTASRSLLLWSTAALLVLMGLFLSGGGAGLAALGGSWFYLAAGGVVFQSGTLDDYVRAS